MNFMPENTRRSKEPFALKNAQIDRICSPLNRMTQKPF
jgi:hypothetical protein